MPGYRILLSPTTEKKADQHGLYRGRGTKEPKCSLRSNIHSEDIFILIKNVRLFYVRCSEDRRTRFSEAKVERKAAFGFQKNRSKINILVKNKQANKQKQNKKKKTFSVVNK